MANRFPGPCSAGGGKLRDSGYFICDKSWSVIAFNRRFGLGIQPDDGFALGWHLAGNTRTPFIIVAQFAFLQAVAGIWDAEALFDFKQILQLRRRHGFCRSTELGRHQDCAAIGLQDLHLGNKRPQHCCGSMKPRRDWP